MIIRVLHNAQQALYQIPALGRTVSPLSQFECDSAELDAELAQRNLTPAFTKLQRLNAAFSSLPAPLQAKYQLSFLALQPAARDADWKEVRRGLLNISVSEPEAVEVKNAMLQLL